MRLITRQSIIVVLMLLCAQHALSKDVKGKHRVSDFPCISGIYPHLAFYNHEAECGTGAVVPWAGSLWAITYAPHSPYGSSDKLYEITPELYRIVYDGSIGGTPADRMIHKESDQLFIGPYAIDRSKNIRSLSYRTAPGRYTGIARHLEHPESKVYIATMEEGFYEVDVNTLETKTLWSDDNVNRRPESFPILEEKLLKLPGWHGKGLYSGQGVLVYSNNGEQTDEALEKFDAVSGSLSEWNGKEWKVVRRNQFTEVTGPGGIYGNSDPENDPIWSVGFDSKSLLIAVRDKEEGWNFFRLPKASHAYDGAHGWNTEWPRIRNVGTETDPDYLMTMHGMFWHFPETFTANNSKGIRPRSSYLKVVGDFARWQDGLVMGCDDSAEKEFLNLRKAKGDIGGPGQSNSNLWFMPLDGPDSFGPTYANGYVWLDDNVKADNVSDPFLFSGWEKRCCWIANKGSKACCFSFETDEDGTGVWKKSMEIILGEGETGYVEFPANMAGEWIRIKTSDSTIATAAFVYAPKEKRKTKTDGIFSQLASIDDFAKGEAFNGGLLWGLGNDKRRLGILGEKAANGEFCVSGYYEADSLMQIASSNDMKTADKIKNAKGIKYKDVSVDGNSVLVVDDKGRRWRLPLGDNVFTRTVNGQKLRICREVATERDLLNCHGTFYELPAENADGYAKIKPIASHDFAIRDFASYRGLLVMTGLKNNASGSHVFTDKNRGFAVWAGAIDDLWKLGKPTGHGGPWLSSKVEKGVPSDPYLFGGYDKRELQLSHTQAHPVSITVEIDPVGDGQWMKYRTFVVNGGTVMKHTFPDAVQGRWIRFVSDTDTAVTTELVYR